MFLVLDSLCEVQHERLVGYVLEVGVEGDLRLHEGAAGPYVFILRYPCLFQSD